MAIALVGLLTAALLGAWLLWWRANPAPTAGAPWVFAVCDVGQGDALFLVTGAGEAVAVDTGPDPAKEDACATRLGITKVPLVILTHFHADHIDGLPGLLRGRSVGAIETTTVDDPPSGAAQVQRIAAAAGIPVSRVAPDEQRTLGPLSWRVLWPQAEHPLAQPMRQADGGGRGGGAAGGGDGGMAEDGPGENSGPNNSSIVMALTVRTDHGSLRILLTGDIETPVQQILLADRAPYLPADVLKVPHHDTARSTHQGGPIPKAWNRRTRVTSSSAQLSPGATGLAETLNYQLPKTAVKALWPASTSMVRAVVARVAFVRPVTRRSAAW